MDNNRQTIHSECRAKIGLYTVGLRAYWAQFSGLRERMIEYGEHIASQLAANGEVFNYGLVDCSDEGRKAGEYFKENDVDLIFLHSGTYVTSDAVLPVHQICGAPVVVLNLQPTTRINYAETTTGEWLAHCGACPVPEFSNAFERAGIPFRVISGLLGLDYTPSISKTDENTAQRTEAHKAYEQIAQWCRAASVGRMLCQSRFGFLGSNYSGMLDLYSDYTMLQAQTGMHVEIIEMCDLNERVQAVTKEQIDQKLAEIHDMFRLCEDDSADPIAKKPSEEDLVWSATVAAAQEQMVRDYRLDALAYYYHSTQGNPYQDIQSGFIVGHSLLTAKGVPCAGEADMKTALAMKICDTLGVGGSFCEIVTADYENGTILLGHDGPFHIHIARGKPMLRGLGVYHGKQGSGVSVEATVKSGPVTMMGITQTYDGRLRMIISEGEATDDEIMRIGNTQTHVRFKTDIDTYFCTLFRYAPTHHCAMSIGANGELFSKVAELLNMEYVVI